MTRARRRKVARAARFAVALAITLLFLFPVYWLFATSFKSANEIYAFPPAWWPSHLDFSNYAQVFRDNEVRALWNSLGIAASSTLGAMAFGTLAAYSLVRFRVGGRALPLIIISLRMIPPVVMVFPLFLLFVALRWVDGYYGLIVLYIALLLPYVVWVMRGYIEDVPIELEESAMIDGASRWVVFTRIVIPMVRNGLFATVVFAFLGAMNEFVFALALSRTRTITFPVQLANLYGEQATFWGKIGALSVLGSLPVFLAVLGLQRYLIRGLGMGAVKG